MDKVCLFYLRNLIDFNNTETITFHDLTAEMPKAFTIDNKNSDNYIIQYSYNDNEKYCAVFKITDIYGNISYSELVDLK